MKSAGLSVVSRTIRRIVSLSRSRRGRATGNPAAWDGDWLVCRREVVIALSILVSLYLTAPTSPPTPLPRGEGSQSQCDNRHHSARCSPWPSPRRGGWPKAGWGRFASLQPHPPSPSPVRRGGARRGPAVRPHRVVSGNPRRRVLWLQALQARLQSPAYLPLACAKYATSA